MRATSSNDACGRSDPGAVHQHARCAKLLGCHLQCRGDALLTGDVASDPDTVQRIRDATRSSFVEIEDGDARPLPG
jgi:hypothetical protein